MTTFAVGSRVVHAKFGKGDVIGRQGTGEKERIEIRFEDGVTRLIGAAFVKPL
ncbi:MAG TPA: hypothetical protein VGM39_18225 [Kofleriaceae bacterium]